MKMPGGLGEELRRYEQVATSGVQSPRGLSSLSPRGYSGLSGLGEELRRYQQANPNDKENSERLNHLSPRVINHHIPTPISLARSPTEFSFVGSLEESLLSGRNLNSCTYFGGFVADIGASGKKCVPAHIQIPFDAQCYKFESMFGPAPYSGIVPLEEKAYRIPSAGLIQVTIFNPSKTPIKTFLVRYDIHDMPSYSKTFIRQKICSDASSATPSKLHYAIHLRIKSTQKRHFYLYKEIRIVFPHRVPDDSESLRTNYDQPDNPRYFPY